MRNKKIGTWIATLLITMLTFMGLGQTMVHAVEVEGPLTDVIITKLETSAGAEERELGEGEDYDDPLEVGDYPGTPLQGVSFTYYSVSEAQLATMIADPGDYDTVAKVDLVPGIGSGVVTGETGANGQVSTGDLGEGFYWFVENTKGTIVSSAAVPFGLALPFTNRAGTGYLEKVYVYPKNVLTDDEPDIEKEVDESNVAIGEVNEWTITVDIPVGIQDYDLFKVTDVIDTRLDFILTDLVVKLGDGTALVDGTDYDATFVSRNLVIDFTAYLNNLELDIDNEGDYIAEQIVITYKTKVNDTAIMGQDIPNDATLDFNNGHGVDKDKTPDEIPSVHTGGKAFVKKDQNNATKLLPGAEFIIKNAAGKFLNITDGVRTFGDEVNATRFISDASGNFEVRGLPYDDYVLVEKVAPRGYALPTNPNTNFTVDANSYHLDPTEIAVGQEPAADVIQTIDNRRLVIPQTGGIGTVLFTVVGAVMMLFSALFYKRTKEA